MKLPISTPSSFSPSSWLSPTISDSTNIISSVRALHLAPSRHLNDTWYISLIQEAKTWEGSLCLHLQPHPIPWIFVVQNDNEAENDDNEEAIAAPAAAAATTMPTSLQVSELVWSELMGLIQNLPAQGRGLHLILERNFIPNSMHLKHLLTVAAPSLTRIETNHPCLLPDLVPNMATRCPYLRTLVMEIPTTTFSKVNNHHPYQNPLLHLTSFLQDPFCQLEGLHLHFSSITRQQATRKQQLLQIQDLFATIAECLHNRRTIDAIKVSGHLDSTMNALLSHDWRNQACLSPGPSSLKKLEIESNSWQLVAVQTHDGTLAFHNVHKNDCSSSTTALAHFFQSNLLASITHLTIRVKEIKVQTLPPPLQAEHSVSKLSLHTILHDAIRVSSLTHLTVQAGLTTSMVDTFLVQLQHATPNLQELDLEGNDMESLELPKFLLQYHPKQTRFPMLQKLYLGSNLFTYSNQMEWVERILYACPRLDIGHRGMPSCGILEKDDNECENGQSTTGRYGTKRSLFASWAHATPLALAWKDWNEHGRYLILLQHSSHAPFRGGLWPLVFEQITKQFHHQPYRQATVLYLFLQSGAIPCIGVCATSPLKTE